MSATVTLEKSYLETLLRKAHFHTGGADCPTLIDVPTVTIPKSDHDSLLASAREYANLRRNLFRGGIAEETLNVLVSEEEPANETDTNTACLTLERSIDEGALVAYPESSVVRSTIGGRKNAHHKTKDNSYATPCSDCHEIHEINEHTYHPAAKDERSDMPEGLDVVHDEACGEKDSASRPYRHQFEKFCKRTVLLANLPESITYADIVSVVKGGMLLDIFIRPRDRVACVSFLLRSSAEEFYRHVKRHDLYIKGRRVDIRWSERQFILPDHVANKIAVGATRNLIIVNRNLQHTEKSIRDDLEHIHNLVVITITFAKQNVHIQTNSVHNSMYARTCMMSRSTYKGSQIKWSSDQCNVPIEYIPQLRQKIVRANEELPPTTNRFQILNTDRSHDDMEEIVDNLASDISLPLFLMGQVLVW